MNEQSRKVSIELQTVIDDDGQMEYNTVKETGELYSRSNLDVLKYEETEEDGAPIKNLITIHADKVSVKRLGAITLNQQFRVKQTSENIVKHPYGSIHMETFTKRMEYKPLTEKRDGLLSLDYTVKLNEQEERKHQLTLTIKKEDSQ